MCENDTLNTSVVYLIHWSNLPNLHSSSDALETQKALLVSSLVPDSSSSGLIVPGTLWSKRGFFFYQ